MNDTPNSIGQSLTIDDIINEIKRYRLLEKQIEHLTQEIETLKQQRIVNP